jgi:hypothetical protein
MDDEDITTLDDPDFFAERRRVRELIEHQPPFAIDVEGEQHRPGLSLRSAVHSWNGGTVPVTTRAPVHESQHPRPPTLMSIAYAFG